MPSVFYDAGTHHFAAVRDARVNPVVGYQCKLGCDGMAALGHAVLCLASKIRSHCVSEDSDAAAYNSKS